MTISPPVKSFGANPHPTTTPLAAARKAQEEAELKAFMESPEGQAVAAAKVAADSQYKQEIHDMYVRNGWLEEEPGAEASDEKAHKNHQKHVPKKSTGFLSGLAAKVQRKNK